MQASNLRPGERGSCRASSRQARLASKYSPSRNQPGLVRTFALPMQASNLRPGERGSCRASSRQARREPRPPVRESVGRTQLRLHQLQMIGPDVLIEALVEQFERFVDVERSFDDPGGIHQIRAALAKHDVGPVLRKMERR